MNPAEMCNSTTFLPLNLFGLKVNTTIYLEKNKAIFSSFAGERLIRWAIAVHGAPQASFIFPNKIKWPIQLIVFDDEKARQLIISIYCSILSSDLLKLGSYDLIVYTGEYLDGNVLLEKLVESYGIGISLSEHDLVWKPCPPEFSGELATELSLEGYLKQISIWEERKNVIGGNGNLN